jgi:hypothetical protein
VRQDALAGAKTRPKVCELVIPHQEERARRVACRRLEDLPPAAPRPALLDRLEHGVDGCRLRGAERGDRPYVAPILVAKRQVEEQILDRRDAELAELLGTRGADALQELHRHRERLELSAHRSARPHVS